MPRISVVIPTYKHADFVAEAITSALAQTRRPDEIIVVNDGSPDHTRATLDSFIRANCITYIEQKNQGQAAARNHGITVATGDFIALLDDDDCWPPNKLAWQVELMERDDALVVVAGEIRLDLESTLRDQAVSLGKPKVATLDVIIQGNPIVSPGQTLIRRSALAQVSGFRPEIWGADDWDLYLRLSRVGRIEKYERPALFYRQHAGNASHQRARMLENARTVLYTHLPEVAPAMRALCHRRARHWLYEYGVRGVLSDLKRSVRRRNLGGFGRGCVELIRRLLVLRFDVIVLRSVCSDCVRKLSN